MGILTWVIVGVLVGSLASFLMKARGLGIVSNLLVSVFGALLGGLDVAYLYKAPGAVNGVNLIGMLVAGIGALMANAILRLFTSRKRPAA